MNISEVLGLAIEASQSGKSGAAVKILQAVKGAIDGGKTDNFFTGRGRQDVIDHAQTQAFEEEYRLKAEVIAAKESPTQEGQPLPDSAA